MNIEQHGPRSAEEASLAAAMRAGAEPLRPPVTQLAAAGLARGRLLRRRRRLQLAGAPVAAAAMATTAALMTGAGGTGDGSAADVPAAGPPAQSRGAPARLTATDVARAVSTLLPGGMHGRFRPVDWGATPGGRRVIPSVSADALLRDAAGSGRVRITVRTPYPEERPTACVAVPGTDATCAVRELADGSTLRLEQDFERRATLTTADGKAGPHGAGANVWSAILVRPDRTVLELRATNSSSAEKHGPKTRATPIFDLNQLTAIVTDPIWKTLPPLPPPPQDYRNDRRVLLF